MKSSVIQIIVTSIFILFGVIGVIVFSVSSTKDSGQNQNVRVSVWGILPKEVIVPVIDKINLEKPGSINMDYEAFDSVEDLEKSFIEALLENTQVPDGIIISHDLLLKLKKRLSLIAWSRVSQRDLQNNFIEGGELFFDKTGTYAIPFLVDPLVLYWNRDIFNSALVTNPPQTWEEVLNLTGTFTERNTNKTIKKTTIALGEYQNILHAKEIISALALQVGASFIASGQNGLVPNVLQADGSTGKPPLETALGFFTQFADPSLPIFSWSRALPDSLLMFLRGDSAMYIGFGSEALDIRAKNPNLNFDIALLPQAKDTKKLTYGKIYGIAIPQEALHKEAMLNTAMILTSSEFQEGFALKSNFAPIRRDLLGKPAENGVLDIVYKSALWSKAWLDPNTELTDELFQEMVEGVTGGKAKAEESVILFAEGLKQILNEIK